ncbi:MAG TPA: hypothetical protein ENO10_00565 [Salinimicrobium catena]|uniref:Beta-carotene 15,15'-monooxygenase n=1 Tax=Salinimicrobium catena TaxID=390640 RepID=A0A7C2RNU2_9FLAO|nr:hypothetical protein [Salinimicrobium catena]
MDELDILKQNWKKQEEDLPRLSYDQIYKMLWKKSSSIVKWIFVISIVELLLSTLLSIGLADADYWAQMEELQLKNFTIGLYIVSYSVTFYFIYRFYVNYRKISATDDAATLMRNILKTRRTVKTYIAFVLISSGLSAVIVAFFTIRNHQLVANAKDVSKYTFEMLDWVKLIVGGLVLLGVFLCALWLFYKLIYGILLKRLRVNYRELKKLEV